MAVSAPQTATPPIAPPDLRSLTRKDQNKLFKKWLAANERIYIINNLDKIMDAVTWTALFLGQYAIYQHGLADEQKLPALGGAAAFTALSYLLKDNNSPTATAVVLTPLVAKIAWDVGGFDWLPWP